MADNMVNDMVSSFLTCKICLKKRMFVEINKKARFVTTMVKYIVWCIFKRIDMNAFKCYILKSDQVTN